MKNKLKHALGNVAIKSAIGTSLIVLAASCSDISKKETTPESTTAKIPSATSSQPSPSSSSSPWGVPVVANSDVSLSIQGSKPSSLALVESSIEVNNPDGTLAGTLDLSYATIVMDKIKLKLAEPASDEESVDEETEDEAQSLQQASLLEDNESSEEIEQDSSQEEDSETESEDEFDAYEYEFSGPFLVDLLTNTMSPDATTLSAAAGVYKEIELSVHKVEDEDAVLLGIDENHDLFKKSIVVKGIYTPVVGDAVNFSMSYEISEEFKLMGSAGTSVVAGQVNDLVIAFRMVNWFDFSNAETNPEGLSLADLPAGDILLEEGSDEVSKKIRDIIKENIKSSADFGKDEDGDGQLSNDEDSESADEESAQELEAEPPELDLSK